MDEKIIKRLEKLKTGQDCWVVHPIDFGNRGRKLVLEDKKTKRYEEAVKVELVYNFDGTMTSSEIGANTSESCAILCGKDYKTLVLLEDTAFCLGYKESSAKFIALIALRDRAILLAYDSSVMQHPYCMFSFDAQESKNLRGLYEALQKSDFCAGTPKLYEEKNGEAGGELS